MSSYEPTILLLTNPTYTLHLHFTGSTVSGSKPDLSRVLAEKSKSDACALLLEIPENYFRLQLAM